MTMNVKWSKDALPIRVRSTGLLFWAVGPAAWVGLLLFGWLVVLPDADRAPMAQVVLIITLMLFGTLVVWLIKLFRRSFRATILVTPEGVEVTRGQMKEFDPYPRCSNFAVFGWTLNWKAVTKRGVRSRTIAGLNFGMSRRELKTLCMLLNALRETSTAQSPST